MMGGQIFLHETHQIAHIVLTQRHSLIILYFKQWGSGKNIIEIYSGESFSVKKVDNTQYPSNPSQSVMLGSIETKSGTTSIDFKYSNFGGGTSTFASNLIANCGNNLITFEHL